MTTQESMIDVAAVAKWLNLHQAVIRRYVEAKRIPFRRIGEGKRAPIRFYQSEVEAWHNGAELKPINNGVMIDRDN